MPQARFRPTGVDRRIEKTFTTPGAPGSFAGLNAVYKAVNSDRSKPKITKTRVAKWLARNRAYSLHRRPTRRFKRRKVIVSGPHAQWQADLVDVSSHAKENKNYRFILTVIDVFRRFAYARPLHSKEGVNIVEAFKSIAKSGAILPKKLQTDKGSEFRNKHFREWCEKNKIKLFHSEDDAMKSSIVERFNRTLENNLFRQMSFKKSMVWVDLLDDAVDAYNNSPHSSLGGRTPASIDYANMSEVFHTLYPPPKHLVGEKSRDIVFKIGDHVRLIKTKRLFDRGYNVQWTNEVFTIRKVEFTTDGSIRLYKVEDLTGEPILGYFYHYELQPAAKPEFKIEKIISEEGDKAYVKWVDRPHSANSYVFKKHVKNFM